MNEKIKNLGRVCGQIEMSANPDFLKKLLMIFSGRFLKSKDDFIELYNKIIQKAASLSIDVSGAILTAKELDNYVYDKTYVDFEFFFGYNEFAVLNSRKKIGEKIKNRRIELDYSQTDIERMTGIKQQNVGRIELGKYSTGIDLITKIYSVLGLSFD